MIDISRLSSRFDIRMLDEGDADLVLSLCLDNPQFYRCCEAEPTREQVLSDMRLLPQGAAPEDKYYFGCFRNGELEAVVDIVDGYPEPGIAFIGFFMVKKELQGQGLGTSLIREAEAYLRSVGKTAVRLAINKGNTQAERFWEKNGFAVIKEVDRSGYAVLVAEKTL